MSNNTPANAFRSRDGNKVAYPSVVGTTSLRLFGEVPFASITERVVTNPGATGKLYLRLVDPLSLSTDTAVNQATYAAVAPGANSPTAIAGVDSGPAVALTGIPVLPGGFFTTQHTGIIEIISDTAASPVTAKER